MSFGFSVGDFIAVGEVIVTLIKSLRETGGSQSEYQELIRELQSLDKALKHVDKISIGKLPGSSMDGIKCAALMCRYPLEEFLGKISKYDRSLGTRASRSVKSVGKKIQWAFTKKDEIQKLLGYLSTHTDSINMMLLTLGLEVFEMANKQAEDNHSSLKGLIEETRVDGIDTKTSVNTIHADFRNQSLVVSSNQSMLTALSTVVNEEVVLPLQSLGHLTTQNSISTQQMLSIAHEIRGMVPSIDTRFTYFQAPIKVEDALGRVFPFPSEYSFDDLQSIIHNRFKEGPGQYRVSSGEYEILNGKNRKQIMSAAYCNRRGFFPGSSLTMAIILDDIRKLDNDLCPMPRCGSTNTSPVIGGGKTCDECGVWFDSHTSRAGQSSPNREQQTVDPLMSSPADESDDHLQPRQRHIEDIEDLMAFKNVKIGELVNIQGNSKHIYCCLTCKGTTDLAPRIDIISRNFRGQHGKAYLFANVVNITLGEPQERNMTTGRHVLRMIYCRVCGTEIGWRYDKAMEMSERYKENKYILEAELLCARPVPAERPKPTPPRFVPPLMAGLGGGIGEGQRGRRRHGSI